MHCMCWAGFYLEMNNLRSKVRSIPSWLSRLYCDDELEVSVNSATQVRLLPQAGRTILWSYANSVLGAERASLGASSHACMIFERFCCAFLHKYADLTLAEWQQKKAELSGRYSLLVAVALQLASKMISAESHLDSASTLRALRRRGLYYTLEQINLAEWELFHCIGFRVPLLTNVQKAQMFAEALCFPEHMFAVAGLMMDLVDLVLGQVTARIKQATLAAPSSSSAGASGDPRSPLLRCARVRTMHLIAGVVVATSLLVRGGAHDPAPAVARWTRADVSYIRVIAHAVLHHIRDHRLHCKLSPTKRPAPAPALTPAPALHSPRALFLTRVSDSPQCGRYSKNRRFS